MTRFLRLFALIIGAQLSCLPPAQAQLNESDTLRWQYNLGAAGSWQSGNLDALALRGKAECSLAPSPRWAVKTQHTYRYQEFYGRRVDHDYAGRHFLYLGQQRRVYPFALAFVSTSLRRQIDWRYFTGAGATWQALRQPGHWLKAALAAVYEETRFASADFNYPEYADDDRIETWRATVWLSGQHQLGRTPGRLYYEAYVQPSWQQAYNFRWQAEAGLEIRIWRGLSLTANYLFTHENVVVRSVKSDDGLLTFGLAYGGKRP